MRFTFLPSSRETGKLPINILSLAPDFPNFHQKPEYPSESQSSNTNTTSSTEDSGEPNNVDHIAHRDNVTTAEPPIAASSRRFSLLPRSASTGNIGRLVAPTRSCACNLSNISYHAGQSISIDDPFLSPGSERPLASFSEVSLTPPTPPRAERVQAVQALKTPEQGISPRQDRLGQEVTPANAQGIHTPAACVFMAK